MSAYDIHALKIDDHVTLFSPQYAFGVVSARTEHLAISDHSAGHKGSAKNEYVRGIVRTKERLHIPCSKARVRVDWTKYTTELRVQCTLKVT